MTFNVHTDSTGSDAGAPDPPAGRDSDENSLQSSSPAVATAGLPGDAPAGDVYESAADRAAGDEDEAAAAVEVTHPVWCDLRVCTAQPAPSMDDYRGPHGSYGQHVSVTVGAGLERLRLIQMVAPWPTAVVVKVVDDHVTAGGLPLASFTLSDLGRYLGELGAVPSGALAEAELARGRDRAGRVVFPPVWTADPAGRYLAGAVQALVTAQQVDPLRLVEELRGVFAVYLALAGGEVRR